MSAAAPSAAWLAPRAAVGVFLAFALAYFFSTLIRAIMGYVPAKAGTVSWQGKPVTGWRWWLCQSIYLPATALPPLCFRDYYNKLSWLICVSSKLSASFPNKKLSLARG